MTQSKNFLRVFGYICLFALISNILLLISFGRSFNLSPLIKNCTYVCQIVSCFTNACGLLLGPGIFISSRLLKESKWNRILFLFVPGIIWAAFIGFLVWILNRQVSPIFLCNLLVDPILGFLGFQFLFRQKKFELLEDLPLLVVGILLVCLIGVGKSLYSLGPVGELYQGSISRTLEVGGISDSRISFENVQVYVNGLHPFSAKSNEFFAPYSFSDRGPLPGLISSVGVILAGSHAPLEKPDHPWSPFDPYGFFAYRVFMIFLASFVAIAAFGVVQLMSTNNDPAFLTFTILCSTPFFIHEVYFTWPKLIAAAFVLLSFGSTVLESSFFSGVFLAVGYFCHPSALLSGPFIGLWILGKYLVNNSKRNVVITSGLNVWCLGRIVFSFFLGFGILVGIWLFLLRHYFSQGEHLNYLLKYDNNAQRTTFLGPWLSSRLATSLNTFFPFYLPIIYAKHPSINSVYTHASPRIIHFFLSYWRCFPFALGLSFVGPFLKVFRKCFQVFPWIALVLVVFPWLFFITFWGAECTGLMIGGAHAMFLATILFTVSSSFRLATQDKADVLTILRSKRYLGFRILEIFLMMFLPIWVTQGQVFQKQFVFTDIFSLALITFAGFQMVRLFEKMGALPQKEMSRGREC